MLRYLTAGESHGQALVATIEGIPAHVRVGAAEVADELRRRRLGVGRGARMKFEADEVTLLTGFRHGETLGSPIAIMVGNSEWAKWTEVMSPGEVDPDQLADLARNAPLTRPRPGHADLAGMQKYDFDEARPILERASARETAARVALGTIAKAFLRQTLGVEVLSHVFELGPVAVPLERQRELAATLGFADRDRVDQDELRCADPDTSAAMLADAIKHEPGAWPGSSHCCCPGNNPSAYPSLSVRRMLKVRRSHSDSSLPRQQGSRETVRALTATTLSVHSLSGACVRMPNDIRIQHYMHPVPAKHEFSRLKPQQLHSLPSRQPRPLQTDRT